MQDVQRRFSPIDESHTRGEAAGNPGALGVAPGGAGGKPGTT